MPEEGTSPRRWRVRDYMTSDPMTLTPQDRLLDAEMMIRSSSVRHLPVMEHGALVGLVTQRDVRRYAPSILDSTPEQYNRIFEQTLVGTVMTNNPATISPDASLSEAINLMIDQHAGCLPVMEGERLAGIITRKDVLRCARDLLALSE
jgi:acetoin utilization protein AcuB